MHNKSKKPHTRIADIKRAANAGPAILQFCHRPFFLAAGLWGALAIPLWILHYSGYQSTSLLFDGLLWHQHEMLFGFAGAAIAGFMLTTIPNWTGRLPVSGWRLALFFFLWLCGRIAILMPATIGVVSASLLDLAFLSCLTFLIAREILAGKNWRNLPMLFLISAFTTGNWLVHAETHDLLQSADLGIRISLYTLTMLVAVIGGRLIPSFTRNWLVKKGSAIRPNPKGLIDSLAYAALLLFAITAISAPNNAITPFIALLSSGLHLIRLIGWKGWAILPEPFMWAQHLAYSWVVIALFLIGLADLTDLVPSSASTHALTTGAFGTMILAVMTRASYTFAGKTLKATKGISTIFVMITLSSILRVTSPFLPSHEIIIMWVSGLAWTIAYGLFVFLFFPLLTQHYKSIRRPS